MNSCEPIFSHYVYHTVRTLNVLTEKERDNCLTQANYNVTNLKPNDITFDLLTDSGNSSQSVAQHCSTIYADDGPVGTSGSSRRLSKLLGDVFGYSFTSLFTQGRSAEKAFNEIFIQHKKYIPGNMTFSTTQYQQSLNGGLPIVVICEEAMRLQSDFVFKGNIDLDQLSAFLKKNHGETSYVNVELCSNAIGGYPISLSNLKAVYEIASLYKVPVILDSTRILENAKLIERNEEGYKGRPIREIVRELCNWSDGCVMSLKKDFLTPVGGLVGVRDAQIAAQLNVYGLLNGAELSGEVLEVIYQGIKESVYSDNHMEDRYSLTRKLYNQLRANGVPVVEPCSCHGIWLNPHPFTIHRSNMQNAHISVQNALYLEGGIRAAAGGFKSKTGEMVHLIRLSLPHRLYSDSHINYIAYVVSKIWKNKEKLIDYTVEAAEGSLIEKIQTRFEPIR